MNWLINHNGINNNHRQNQIWAQQVETFESLRRQVFDDKGKLLWPRGRKCSAHPWKQIWAFHHIRFEDITDRNVRGPSHKIGKRARAISVLWLCWEQQVNNIVAQYSKKTKVSYFSCLAPDGWGLILISLFFIDVHRLHMTFTCSPMIFNVN